MDASEIIFAISIGAIVVISLSMAFRDGRKRDGRKRD